MDSESLKQSLPCLIEDLRALKNLFKKLKQLGLSYTYTMHTFDKLAHLAEKHTVQTRLATRESNDLMGWGGRWERGSGRGGDICTPMDDSYRCMAKITTIL